MPGWPNGFDLTMIACFVTLAVGAPALGYVCMAIDIRAYWRSLRRALVVVVNYLPHLPAWARLETPRCLAVFGLSLDCTSEQLDRAYRRKVKELHPDRGGDPRRFQLIVEYYEQARGMLRE
jgi:hypothetical protein